MCSANMGARRLSCVRLIAESLFAPLPQSATTRASVGVTADEGLAHQQRRPGRKYHGSVTLFDVRPLAQILISPGPSRLGRVVFASDRMVRICSLE